MAKNLGKIYLGYEEEPINLKSQNPTATSYKVNKIGGLPDWPPLDNLQFASKCPFCGLHRFLVVQCYAPIENSIYHRTLYLFACINPNCWMQSESWICVRSQLHEDPNKTTKPIVAIPPSETTLNWCKGSNDWDEDDGTDNNDLANGNMDMDNHAANSNNEGKNSDEDEESSSFEIDQVETALQNLQVYDAHNANMASAQGAVGGVEPTFAAAELEGGDEPGLVTIDSPSEPVNDVQALLNQTAELPPDVRNHLVYTQLQFAPKFIYVEEEWTKPSNVDDKIMELLNRYKNENEIPKSPSGDVAGAVGGGDDEQYEEATPLHGDKLFHNFVTRLKNNPGQILRYSRDESPVLGAPLPSSPNSPDSRRQPLLCTRCGSRLICEIQLVPEFANSLVVLPHNINLSHLHFLSVLVFTCSQSCWQPGDTLVKEMVVFQPEII